MKRGSLLVFAVALLCSGGFASTITNTWQGLGAGSNNWSLSDNWSSGQVPASGNYVLFTDSGATSTVSNIDNVVDADFNNVIGTLQFGNTNNNHTMLIPDGQTLMVTNGLIIGTETSISANAKTNTIIPLLVRNCTIFRVMA
jgi:hypothetical protein